MSRIDTIGVSRTRFISIRRWQAGPEWRPRAHKHDFHEIVVVLRGADHAVVEGTPYDCSPGHVLLYPPACLHEERQAGPDPLEFLCVNFEWDDSPLKLPILLHDRQGRLQELARWLYTEDRARYGQRGEFQNAGVALLAAELHRLATSPPDDVLAPLYEYVQENLAEPITLDDLAECCGLNKFHLSRVFRARTGCTPMDYVRQARLDYAHRLVMETTLPLREIAPRAGFANEYHLSRLLKARYGRGAREIRQSRMVESGPAS